MAVELKQDREVDVLGSQVLEHLALLAQTLEGDKQPLKEYLGSTTIAFTTRC